MRRKLSTPTPPLATAIMTADIATSAPFAAITGVSGAIVATAVAPPVGIAATARGIATIKQPIQTPRATLPIAFMRKTFFEFSLDFDIPSSFFNAHQDLSRFQNSPENLQNFIKIMKIHELLYQVHTQQ